MPSSACKKRLARAKKRSSDLLAPSTRSIRKYDFLRMTAKKKSPPARTQQEGTSMQQRRGLGAGPQRFKEPRPHQQHCDGAKGAQQDRGRLRNRWSTRSIVSSEAPGLRARDALAGSEIGWHAGASRTEVQLDILGRGRSAIWEQ